MAIELSLLQRLKLAYAYSKSKERKEDLLKRINKLQYKQEKFF